MRLLRIILNGEEHPNYTLTKEFEKKFDYVKNEWWEQHDKPALNGHLKWVTKNEDFDAIFMQIQQDGIIQQDTAEFMSNRSLVFNWTGDVRCDLSAYQKIAKYVVTLFTNTTDVEKMRSCGFLSDYLQTGYDHKYYFYDERKSFGNIVFCGNYYDSHKIFFPLTNYRAEIAKKLKENFGDKFNIYGQDWIRVGVHAEFNFANNEQEAEIYRTCGVAISCSHFNYGRYFSDRLLREMACGAFVLSHKYQDYEMDFINGKHFVVFDDLDDLVEKCKYYLTHTEEAERIGREASNYVSQNFRWGNFVDNFIELIKKYKK